MKISIHELAGLPGMPSHARSVRRLARREGWPRSNGKRGECYHIDHLPPETRAALITVQVPTITEIEGRPLGGNMRQTWMRAPVAARETATFRAQCVIALHRLRCSGISLSECYPKVSEAMGESVPERNLRRWYKTVRDEPGENWPALLLPKYKPTATLTEIHPDAWEWLLSDYLRLSRPGLAACYRRLLHAAQQHAEWGEIPSEQSLRRRLKAEVQPTTLMIRREGLEKFDHAIPAQERDKSALSALSHVNADGHRFDVFVRFPWKDSKGHDVIARPMMITFQDIYSGKILSWRLDETENTDAIRLAFADMVRDWGIPEKLTLDNGRAFTGKKMTGGMVNRFRFKRLPEEPLGVYLTFGIDVKCTKPYHGQSKPIERCFRDLCEDVARHPLCQGAYTGNRVDAKPEDYASRAVGYEEFVALVEQQIKEHNARSGRRSKLAAGGSLDELFFASYHAEDNIIRRATDAQVQWLMLPVEGCQVSRDEAVISLMGNRFWHERLLQHRGEKVIIRFDPQRVQDGIFVFRNGEIEPLCHAQCIAATGFESTEAARRDARARKIIKTAHARAAAVQGAIPAQELAKPIKASKPLSTEARAKTGRAVVHVDFAPQSRPPQGTEGEDMVVNIGRQLLAQRKAELAHQPKTKAGKLRAL